MQDQRRLDYPLFGSTDFCTQERIEYYHKCGLDVLDVSKIEKSVKLERANGFEAFAFSSSDIASIAAEYGYRVAGIERDDVCGLLQLRSAASETV